MGIFENLVNKLPLGGEEDDYEDDEMDGYEDDEEYDEDRGERKLFNSRGRKNRPQDEEEEEYEEAPRSNGSRASIKGNSSTARTGNGTQLSTIRGGRAPMPSSSKMQVRIIKPSSFDQARQITDTLLAHRTVLLNLEGLDVNTAQRIVDFASGSCYALHGNFMKISHFIIVITPEDVDIAGDIAGGRPDAVAGMLANAAAQNGSMGGMDGSGAAPFMNNTMNMNMNGGY